MTEYRKRELTGVLKKALAAMPVVVVTGMRQVGKSTLLLKEEAFRGRRYLTLDDFSSLEEAKRNPESLLGGSKPVTIDEAQKCPELLQVVKQMVDKDRKPGQFLLSGSANFSLLKGVAETLAGRAVYLTLRPFTYREVHGNSGKVPFLAQFFRSPRKPVHAVYPLEPEAIRLGGMPSVCLGECPDPSIWFKGYEQTYLERDLRDFARIEDLITFRYLMKLAAFRSGQILKVSELARDAKLNSVTASRYLELLETSFVIERLSPFLGSRSSRLIKSPKMYFSDSGLAGYLMDINDLESGSDTQFRGRLFETYVAANLASLIESYWPTARLHFWCVQGRHEVDFVIEAGREVMAIEMKSGSRWKSKDLSGLKAFIAKTPSCRVAILAYNGTESVCLNDRLWILPLGALLS